MSINRAQLKKQLQEGLNTVFGLRYKQHEKQWPAIFDAFKSNKAYEEETLMTGFGAAPVKEEGDGVSYDNAREAWTSRYTNETIAIAFSITEEAVEDNLYGDIGNKLARALARSIAHTEEVKAAAVLNNGFSSSYPGGDGKELFATDHPLVSGADLRNELATSADLSEASLEEALIDIGDFQDDRGLQIKVNAKKLIVPVELQFTAARILKSSYRPGTADNDINVINQMSYISGGHHVNNYLTDPDAWFIITDQEDGLKRFNRVALQRGMEGDFESGNLRYKARTRFVYGWTDPRGAYGSPGA